MRIYRGRVSFLPVYDDDNDDSGYKPKNSNTNIFKNATNYADSRAIKRLRVVHEHKSVQFSHLTPFDKPVPNDWLTIEDSFVLVIIVNLPLAGQDFFVAPDSTYNDNCMHMVYIRQGATRSDLLSIFNSAKDGSFLKSPHIEYVKIKAFRLEPLDTDNSGNLMVDGERVPYGRIQGEVVPKLGCFLTKTSTNKNNV
jgi:diacylglycerol kinase family enzyme